MHKTGTASGYLDLMDQLDAFLCDQGSAFAVVPDVSNVGDGRVTAYTGGSASVAETITLTATDATHFAVSGSVSGSLGTATVGTPFTSTKVNLTIATGGTAFAGGDQFTLSTAPKWTQLRGPVTATSTRWRVRDLGYASYRALGAGTIEMMLTAGGADQCAGSGGTAVASTESSGHGASKAFDGDGSTYWQATTRVGGWIEYQFTATKAIKQVAMTPPPDWNWLNLPLFFVVEYHDGTKWVVAGTFGGAEDSGGVAERRAFDLAEYVWQAPGNDGGEAIIMAAAPMAHYGLGVFDWRLQAYTGYSGPTVDFFHHPGAIPVDPEGTGLGPALNLWNTTMTYWFFANGRRTVAVVKVGSTYEAMYLGHILPFASPGQWPYPIAVGGSMSFTAEPSLGDARWKYASTEFYHSCFPCSRGYALAGDGGRQARGNAKLFLRSADGTWRGLTGYNDYSSYIGVVTSNKVWPYCAGFRNLKANLDGTVPLLPVMLHRTSAPVDLYGVLDGVLAVSSDGVGAESEVAVGYDRYLVFFDAFRSDAMDFFAVRED